MTVNRPGRSPTYVEQWLLSDFLSDKLRLGPEQVIVHHISENTPHRVQLEIELRKKDVHNRTKCRFVRYVQKIK